MIGLRPKYPHTAIEIGNGYASAVRMHRAGGRLRLAAWKRIELPSRTVSEDDVGGELALDDDIRLRLGDLLEPIGHPKRLSIVLPDSAVRSFFVELENPPSGDRELRDMILFKLSKLTPVNLEGAAIAYQRLGQSEEGIRYLAMITSRKITNAYEDFFESQGIRVGLIETASLAAINLFAGHFRESGGDFAIFRVAGGYFTAALFLGGELAFGRTRRGAISAAAVAKEARTLTLFAQDKLESEGFSRVYLNGPLATEAEIPAELERAGFEAALLDLEEVVDLPPLLRGSRDEQGTLIAAAGAAGRN